jgi:hypothetical protein
MTRLARAGWIAFASLCLLTSHAVAQPANFGCTSKATGQGTQTLQCDTAITIVTEDGAKFELKDRNRDGRVDSVELSNKALLIEVPKKPGGNRFNVVTPQAIAAVRGTKWAVDASELLAMATSSSSPATASMSNRREHWSSSAGRLPGSRP